MEYRDLLKKLFDDYNMNVRESNSLLYILSDKQSKELYKLIQKVALRASLREILKRNV